MRLFFCAYLCRMEKKKKKPTPSPSRRDGSGNAEEKKEKGMRKEHKKNWRELYASIDDIKQFLLERVILRHHAADGGSRHRAGTEAAGRGDGTAGGLRAVAERVAGMDKAHPLPLPKGGD